MVVAGFDGEIDRVRQEAEAPAGSAEWRQRGTRGRDQGGVDHLQLAADALHVIRFEHRIDVPLQHADLRQVVANRGDGGSVDGVGVPEQQQVGCDVAADLAQRGVGSGTTQAMRPEHRGRSGDVAIGEVGHAVAVADQAIGELDRNAVLEGTLRLQAEVCDMQHASHSTPFVSVSRPGCHGVVLRAERVRRSAARGLYGKLCGRAKPPRGAVGRWMAR